MAQWGQSLARAETQPQLLAHAAAPAATLKHVGAQRARRACCTVSLNGAMVRLRRSHRNIRCARRALVSAAFAAIRNIVCRPQQARPLSVREEFSSGSVWRAWYSVTCWVTTPQKKEKPKITTTVLLTPGTHTCQVPSRAAARAGLEAHLDGGVRSGARGQAGDAGGNDRARREANQTLPGDRQRQQTSPCCHSAVNKNSGYDDL